MTATQEHISAVRRRAGLKSYERNSPAQMAVREKIAERGTAYQKAQRQKNWEAIKACLRENPEMNAGEVADVVGLHKVSVYRIISAVKNGTL